MVTNTSTIRIVNVLWWLHFFNNAFHCHIGVSHATSATSYRSVDPVVTRVNPTMVINETNFWIHECLTRNS